MKFKLIYWMCPLLFICVGIFPKFFTLDDGKTFSPNIDGNPISTDEGVNIGDISEDLNTLKKRDFFGSNLPNDVVTVQDEQSAEPLWINFDYQLVGIAISGNRKTALLVDPITSAKISVIDGETIVGWTVKKILSGSVELTRDNETLWIELFQPEGK